MKIFLKQSKSKADLSKKNNKNKIIKFYLIYTKPCSVLILWFYSISFVPLPFYSFLPLRAFWWKKKPHLLFIRCMMENNKQENNSMHEKIASIKSMRYEEGMQNFYPSLPLARCHIYPLIRYFRSAIIFFFRSVVHLHAVRFTYLCFFHNS